MIERFVVGAVLTLVVVLWPFGTVLGALFHDLLGSPLNAALDLIAMGSIAAAGGAIYTVFTSGLFDE